MAKPMISAIDHIQLAMPPGSENKARAFFRDLLGMREDEKPGPLASRGGCWFRSGAAILHLGVEENFAPQKKAHPAFIAADLDDIAATFMMAGYPVKWDETLPDRQRFYTDDPFGNRLEFMRDGDGFAQK
jgi:catechol 2,3-dioxygenase-like lactoylglutathione lyase family enzyme